MPKTKKIEKKEKIQKESGPSTRAELGVGQSRREPCSPLGFSPEQTKRKVKKPAVKKKIGKSIPKPKREKYYEAEGRRKTAVARIRLFTCRVRKTSAEEGVSDFGENEFLVNGKLLQQYFSIFELQQIARDSLEKMKCLDRFRVSALVRGGGLKAQAEAIRHGIARALVLFNPTFRKRLKVAGFLRRDPRMRERKKFGLKRARRAPQWQKR